MQHHCAPRRDEKERGRRRKKTIKQSNLDEKDDDDGEEGGGGGGAGPAQISRVTTNRVQLAVVPEEVAMAIIMPLRFAIVSSHQVRVRLRRQALVGLTNCCDSDELIGCLRAITEA